MSHSTYQPDQPLGPTHKDLLVQLRDEPYTSLGGYPKYAVTDDCGSICSKCATEEFDRLDEAEPNDGFYISRLTVNWEDNDLYCDHCNDTIESAYGDDDEEDES